MSNNTLLAFVGMPGSGKSQAVSYIAQKGIPFVRFGDVTEEKLTSLGLPVTAENEQKIREELRKTVGMDAYAKAAKPKIEALLQNAKTVVIDGLYSWEEYTFLKETFSGLLLVALYAEPAIRYERLAKRAIRKFTKEEAIKRDISEIEKLNKGGPIAIADFLLQNNTTKEDLYKQIDTILLRLGINV